MKAAPYFLTALVIILIDQFVKLYVYNNMYIHEEISIIGDWFKFHYLLNEGMAFGIKWKSEFGKLALTVFRIVAMFGIGYYLIKMSNQNVHKGFLICLGLILGGAIGNVIDSTFYGVFLNNHPPEAVTPWFHGQVIDMLFFPIFDFNWPTWVPIIGGDNFLFFSPVFNVADSSIFMGVVVILIMQKKFFKDHKLIRKTQEVDQEQESDSSTTEQHMVQQKDISEETGASTTSFINKDPRN